MMSLCDDMSMMSCVNTTYTEISVNINSNDLRWMFARGVMTLRNDVASCHDVTFFYKTYNEIAVNSNKNKDHLVQSMCIIHSNNIIITMGSKLTPRP